MFQVFKELRQAPGDTESKSRGWFQLCHSPSNTTLNIGTWVTAKREQLSSTIPSERELDKQKRRRRSAKWRGRLLQRGHRLGVIGNKMSSPPHFVPDLEQVIKSLCCLICPAYKMDQAFIRNCFVSVPLCTADIFIWDELFLASPPRPPQQHEQVWRPNTHYWTNPVTGTHQTNTETKFPGLERSHLFPGEDEMAQGALCSLLRKWLILISAHREDKPPILRAALLLCCWCQGGGSQDHRWNGNNNP